MQKFDNSGIDATVQAEQIASAINNAKERKPDFWKLLYEQGVRNLQIGIDEAQKIQKRSLEMLKFLILLGTLYMALFSYDIPGVEFSLHPMFISIPFILLLSSAFIFLYGYFTLSSVTLGPSISNPHTAIRENYEAEKYRQMMVAAYFGWSEDNFDLIQDAKRRFTYGLGIVFASIGSVVTLFILG